MSRLEKSPPGREPGTYDDDALPEIARALAIEPDKTYVLEISRPCTEEELERVVARWEGITGAKCVVLSEGIRMVGETE